MFTGQKPWLKSLLGSSEFIWALAALVAGSVIYALHYTLLEYLFAVLSIYITQRWYGKLLSDRTDGMPARALRHWLTKERWARPASENLKVQSQQARLQNQYSWLVFTYCSGYALLFAAAATLTLTATLQVASTLVIGLGILMLLAAFRADVDITRKEIWLNEKFPQLPAEV